MKFGFNVPSVSKKKSELNLDHSHVMSHNFGVHQIVSVIDMIPNSDITVDISAFTRLTPLPCPTFGGVKITHRAYFVPLEFCFKHFNDFVSFQKLPYLNTSSPGTVSSNLSHFKMPYFQVRDIFMFLHNTDDLTHSIDSDYLKADSSGRYDVFGCDGVLPAAFKYTVKGRRIVSWLAQLGYKLSPYSCGGLGSSSPTTVGSLKKRYSADALFAFWKYYLDWVVPARFVLSNPRFVYIKSVLDNLECNNQEYHLVFKSNGNFSENELDISQFLMVPTSFLDDDQYTTAFVTPYGPENSSSALPDGVSGLDVSGDSMPSYLNPSVQPNGIAGVINFTDPNTRLNDISLLSLGRLQQLVNAKKITSTNVLDFLRVNYGITPSHDAMRLSTYLGNFDSQIMVGDIMATATTDSTMGTTVVGQYAGKGLGGSSAKWRVKSSMHGILFITAEISTKSSYVNGVSPLRSRFDALDFFNEKFDNVGVRAVRQDELIMNDFEPLSSFPETFPEPDHVFGFHPRYSEYKFHDDIVSGDFMFPSVNLGMDSWYLSRKFKMTEQPTIGLEFLSATSDSVGSQYDRIFQNTANVDHFYSVYYLNVHETSLKEKFFDYFKSMNETDEDNDIQDVKIN